MPRSLRKGPYCHPKLLKKIAAAKAAGSTSVKQTWARSSTILPDMVGFTIGVHNGKDFVNVFIDEEKVGHKLGEFAPTTRFKGHGGKNAK
jgi:small subunit ribosomal protein S19